MKKFSVLVVLSCVFGASFLESGRDDTCVDMSDRCHLTQGAADFGSFDKEGKVEGFLSGYKRLWSDHPRAMAAGHILGSVVLGGAACGGIIALVATTFGASEVALGGYAVGVTSGVLSMSAYASPSFSKGVQGITRPTLSYDETSPIPSAGDINDILEKYGLVEQEETSPGDRRGKRAVEKQQKHRSRVVGLRRKSLKKMTAEGGVCDVLIKDIALLTCVQKQTCGTREAPLFWNVFDEVGKAANLKLDNNCPAVGQDKTMIELMNFMRKYGTIGSYIEVAIYGGGIAAVVIQELPEKQESGVWSFLKKMGIEVKRYKKSTVIPELSDSRLGSWNFLKNEASLMKVGPYKSK